MPTRLRGTNMTYENRTKYGYMRTKHNWTPSDYDITFNPNDIPSNINYIDADNLTKHLQSKIPLTRKVHLQLTPNTLENKNTLLVKTGLILHQDNKNIEVEFK